MKQTLFFLLLLFHIQSKANMSEPVDHGTLGSSPFTSQFVDILHEDLKVKIDKDFNFAYFDVEYHIKSSEDGTQIPLLFYASDLLDSFTVSIDGKVLELKETDYYLGDEKRSKFKNFAYFFESSSDRDHVLIEESPDQGFFVDLQQMIYFKTDISKGEHIIKVSYRATKWIDRWSWVKEYSFRYALSPAKYWKSFGTLDLTIDATDYPNPLVLNIEESETREINTIEKWQFNDIPIGVLQIMYLPKISSLAQAIINIGTFRLALIIGLILTFLHALWTISYRKKHTQKKHSIIVSLGSVIVPLIFFLIWLGSYGLIDNLIGEHATKQHGYAQLAIVLYPMVMLAYWIVFYIIDRSVKKKMA